MGQHADAGPSEADAEHLIPERIEPAPCERCRVVPASSRDRIETIGKKRSRLFAWDSKAMASDHCTLVSILAATRHPRASGDLSEFVDRSPPARG